MLSASERNAVLRVGRRLSVLSIILALLEAILAIPAGVAAGSIALLGFGLDSFIEAGSAGAMLWGLFGVADEQQERREQVSLKIVGALLLALAAFIAYDSISSLVRRDQPHRSVFGIVILVGSLGAMVWLRGAKRRVAAGLGSHALVADSKQTEFCAYLSAIALVGLILNAAFGLWWADPIAAAIMVPIIIREGLEAVQGKACAHE